MSSLLVVQEQRQMIFAVDTACSRVICETSKEKSNKSIISRYKDKVADKVHQVGKDMVFVSGMNTYTDTLEEKLKDFLDKRGHINVELLKHHLIKNYPYSNSICKQYGYSDIGIVILQIINNESIIIKLDQASDFVPSESRATQNEVKLSVDGFDNKKIYENGSKFLNRLTNFAYRTPEALITIYQNSYSEGVGNSIRVYKMDWSGCSLLKDHKLTEEGLIYVNFDADGREYVDADKVEFTAHLQGAAGTFTGTVQAGAVVGGTVEGAIITGSTINGTVINGCTINGGEFYSDNPNNQQSTTIEGGVITTNALICDGGAEGQFLAQGNYLQMWHPSLQETFHLNGQGEMMCKKLDCPTINNSTPITSSNLQSQMNNLLVTSPYASVAQTANNTGWSYKSGGIANSSSDNNTVYVSSYGNFRPVYSDSISCGTSGGLWSSIWSSTATIQTSDVRKKNSIEELDSRYEVFFDCLISKRFKMNSGTSNRYHIGWISQEIEEALTTAELTSLDFAGFVKDPIYSKMKLDEEGNETDEYDTMSEIIDYNYFLRYEEFISLVAHKIKCVETKYTDKLNKLEQQMNQLLESMGK